MLKLSLYSWRGLDFASFHRIPDVIIGISAGTFHDGVCNCSVGSHTGKCSGADIEQFGSLGICQETVGVSLRLFFEDRAYEVGYEGYTFRNPLQSFFINQYVAHIGIFSVAY
jgi:hypothetical protein